MEKAKNFCRLRRVSRRDAGIPSLPVMPKSRPEAPMRERPGALSRRRRWRNGRGHDRRRENNGIAGMATQALNIRVNRKQEHDAKDHEHEDDCAFGSAR